MAEHTDFVAVTAAMIPPDLYQCGCEVMAEAFGMLKDADPVGVQSRVGGSLKRIAAGEDATREDFLAATALLLISIGLIDTQADDEGEDMAALDA